VCVCVKLTVNSIVLCGNKNVLGSSSKLVVGDKTQLKISIDDYNGRVINGTAIIYQALFKCNKHEQHLSLLISIN